MRVSYISKMPRLVRYARYFFFVLFVAFNKAIIWSCFPKFIADTVIGKIGTNEIYLFFIQS